MCFAILEVLETNIGIGNLLSVYKEDFDSSLQNSKWLLVFEQSRC